MSFLIQNFQHKAQKTCCMRSTKYQNAETSWIFFLIPHWPQFPGYDYAFPFYWMREPLHVHGSSPQQHISCLCYIHFLKDPWRQILLQSGVGSEMSHESSLTWRVGPRTAALCLHKLHCDQHETRCLFIWLGIQKHLEVYFLIPHCGFNHWKISWIFQYSM